MQELLKELLHEVKSLKEGQSRIENKLDSAKIDLKSDIAVIDAKIDLLAQNSQDDVKGMIKLSDKKIDRIDTKISILNNHLLEQETDIQLIKKAQ